MEFAGFFILLFLATTTACIKASSSPALSSLRQGSFWTVDEKERETFLVSPNGTFSAAFHEVGINAFCFSIWFTRSADKTIVWMANRNTPVSRKKSRMTLHKNGNMVLTDAFGSSVWSTNTFSASTVEVRLLETGNLVLFDQGKEKIIWESFDFPTDTLLPLQRLVKNTTLVSMRSKGSYLNGIYNFKFDDNNVLNLIYDGPQISSIYWPRKAGGDVFDLGRTPYNSSRVAILDEFGRFVSSDLMEFRASDYGFGPLRRLTLDYDGMLRLYSLDESTGHWDISWLPSAIDSCLVDGICGEYGICSYKSIKPACTCPFGFERNDLSDWSKGCRPSFNLSRDSNTLDFMQLLNTDYYGYDLETLKFGISFDKCRNSCLTDTRCKGFGYSFDGQAMCFPKGQLVNGYQMPDSQSVMYIKVPKQKVSSQTGTVNVKVDGLSCTRTEVVLTNNDAEGKKRENNEYMKYLVAFVGSFGVIEVICLGFWWWFIYRKRVNEEVINMGYMTLAIGFKRFTYKELKRATKNFKEEIGKGGFGSVYKGILDDGRAVAVKRLEGILQGTSEFWAEVSVIGNINHRNLVKLGGFCAENEHKLLVYDYVENGSLDKFLFSDSSPALGFEQRHKIAVGTAKGLSYLHEECLEWVLHCDVKPQNILLDDQLEPKVADFGMSKLFKDVNNDVGFSRVRGTRGYLAPEWMMNLKIDAKADVYSYGIVLLELLSGKCVSDFLSDTAHDNVFNHLVQWMTEKIRQEGYTAVIDPRLLNDDFDPKKVESLLNVALLCVHEDRHSRPAMSKVVELLLEADEQA
ncbi:Putative receptor protein kinase ZmPK1 [Morus notabilis]|uniref:Receptor-like serine/threonine-protein kinase n=1 Tax=Morus notabilis TaxID=981085 RepID=W9QN88_9ROSA|nr:putative receptor protein kinase ZmPK1 [Morus notabilis]EXB36711.1 Putative receptor protein kinase ZmPK1 [Morus notabilis]